MRRRSVLYDLFTATQNLGSTGVSQVHCVIAFRACHHCTSRNPAMRTSLAFLWSMIDWGSPRRFVDKGRLIESVASWEWAGVDTKTQLVYFVYWVYTVRRGHILQGRNSRAIYFRLGQVWLVHAYNPNTQEDETGGLWAWRQSGP